MGGSDTGTPVTPVVTTGTTWTKRQFVLAAYDELAMAGYEFDLTPEMLQAALQRLDAMMSNWNEAWSVDIGYPLPITSTSDLDDTTDVEYQNNETVFLNLAVRLAAKHGKPLNSTTISLARQGFNLLLRVTPPTMSMPSTMPRGAGAKNIDFPYCTEE